MPKCFDYFLFVCLLTIATESVCQMRRGQIKANNKRLSGYAGPRKAFSQRYNSIGVSLNIMNYYGDLAPLPNRISTDVSQTKPSLGFSFARRYGPRYSLQAQFLYGTIGGADRTSANPANSESRSRYLRNLSFRNHIKEFSVAGYFDLFSNRSWYVSRKLFTPFAFIGLSLLLHNPKAQTPAFDLDGNALPDAGDWISLRPLGTEGQYASLDPSDVNNGIKPYSLLVVAIPFGIGSRFKLNDLTDLSIELGIRYTFTDYLDDVSRNYVDLGTLKSPLAKAMSYRTGELGLPTDGITYQGRDLQFYTVQNGYGQEQKDNKRGNKSEKDMYMVMGVRITRIIPYLFEKPKNR